MKKIIFIFLVLTVTCISLGCSFQSENSIQNTTSPSQNLDNGIHYGDCPLAKTVCSYPGSCGRYVDNDNDNNCDHTTT